MIKKIHRRLVSRSDFAGNVLVMVGGTVFAQGLQILAYPIITRLYAPDDFGVWSLFMSIAATLGVIASLRYEMSIVLPKSDEEAFGLVSLSLIITIVMSLTLLLISSFFLDELAYLIGDIQVNWVLWTLGPFVFLLGSHQVFASWLTRSKKFKLIATARVIQTFCTLFAQLMAFSLIKTGSFALIAGTVLGQAVGTSVISLPIIKLRDKIKINLRFQALREKAIEFKNFPLYTAPYSLVGTFSKHSLLFLLGIYATTEVVGLFSLAIKITYFPIRIISAALNQVFFQKAATELGEGRLGNFVIKVLFLLGVGIEPLLVLFVFNAQEIFGLVFGSEWFEAGFYAIFLALSSAMLLLTSWLDRIYDVTGKQRLALGLEVIYDLVAIGVFALSLILYKNIRLAVVLYAITTCIYNMIWLVITFKVAKFSLRGLWRLGSVLSIILIITTITYLMMMMVIQQKLYATMMFIVLLIVYYGYIGSLFMGSYFTQKEHFDISALFSNVQSWILFGTTE